MNRFIIFLCTLGCLVGEVTAQGGVSRASGHDSLFMEARHLAFEGDGEKALIILEDILSQNPDYHDASVLAARIYSWQGGFNIATEYIDRVLNSDPSYYEALIAAADIGIWSGNLEYASAVIDTAMESFPEDHELLYRRALVLSGRGKPEMARDILNKILSEDENHEESIRLLDSLDSPGFYYYRENNYLLAGYYGEFIRDPYKRDFHMGTAGYSHYTSIGPVTGKINFANTFFDGTGLTRYPALQFEAEAYPRLSQSSYLFLNYAYSNGIVFPGHRGAVEYFRALPHAFEGSLGLRYIYWNSSYFFYTGSVGYYHGNMWFSVRPYLLPGDHGLSSSWYLSARKYFDSADDFAGIILGYGFSPDEPVTGLNGRLNLKTWSFAAELSKSIGVRYLIRSSIRYELEEFQASDYRNRWALNIGLRYYLTGR